jgi:hypothetical protein
MTMIKAIDGIRYGMNVKFSTVLDKKLPLLRTMQYPARKPNVPAPIAQVNDNFKEFHKVR